MARGGGAVAWGTGTRLVKEPNNDSINSHAWPTHTTTQTYRNRNTSYLHRFTRSQRLPDYVYVRQGYLLQTHEARHGADREGAPGRYLNKIEHDTMRKPYDTPYQSDSPDAVWTNARIGEGYEIRMDATNRLNVYRVAISYGGYSKETKWVITRIPWAVAPAYVHNIREHMAAVLKMLAERETRET